MRIKKAVALIITHHTPFHSYGKFKVTKPVATRIFDQILKIMSNSLGQKSPRKSKPTFTYAVLSVSVILLLVGALSSGFFAVNKALIDIKERIEIEVELKTDVSEQEVAKLDKYFESAEFINTYEFQSKEEAIKEFEKELNQDIMDIAGFNPLYDAYIITLKNEYSQPDKLEEIKVALQQQAGVRGINYSSAVIELVNANIKKVMTVGAVVISILLLVAFSLIDNTIRLLMFSQRFIIRSMQLIGATKSFIIMPFIKKGALAGLIAGSIAILLIAGGISLLQQQYGWFELEQQDYYLLAGMALALLSAGVLICLLSTYLSVNKYLSMKLDELY
jgi:cell division transport system permease protein